MRPASYSSLNRCCVGVHVTRYDLDYLYPWAEMGGVTAYGAFKGGGELEMEILCLKQGVRGTF